MVATAGLLLVIFALVRSGRSGTAPAAVGAYIGAAYWFTSSTSFANPAITVGRMFSNTFAGIAPSSVPAFVGAQILGGLVAFAAIKALYPTITAREAAEVVAPHPGEADPVVHNGPADRQRETTLSVPIRPDRVRPDPQDVPVTES
jgi:arsenate reductase